MSYVIFHPAYLEKVRIFYVCSNLFEITLKHANFELVLIELAHLDCLALGCRFAAVGGAKAREGDALMRELRTRAPLLLLLFRLSGLPPAPVGGLRGAGAVPRRPTLWCSLMRTCSWSQELCRQ